MTRFCRRYIPKATLQLCFEKRTELDLKQKRNENVLSKRSPKKNCNFPSKIFCNSKIMPTFATQNEKDGAIAQLVEQRTENPCVPGSIPGGTTEKRPFERSLFLLFARL